MQLWGYLLLGNVLVVGWELVAVETEGTYPDTGAHVNLATRASAIVYIEGLGLAIPERVENGLAWGPADDGLILKQRRVGLLLQRGVEGANGDNETRGFLYRGQYACLAAIATRQRRRSAYHARARKRVPTEAEAISVLDLAPLVLEGLEVSHGGRLLRRAMGLESKSSGWDWLWCKGWWWMAEAGAHESV